MRFLSVCSGIEAASVAWQPLGWRAIAFSEIEPFPCAVLAHHYPNVPNHGDMTRFNEWPDHAIDLLCGGTPCQSFSVAGLRKGLDDPRGDLMLTFGAIAAKHRPRWLVWENVPGVLSSNGGRDFGVFLGLLGFLGYGFAYRVLDAQYFGLAQRRKRVFVVGCLGDWRSAAAVLFERHSLSGHPAPSREARQGTAIGALAGTSPCGGWRVGADEAAAGQLVAGTLNAGMGRRSAEDPEPVHVMPFDTTQITSKHDRAKPDWGRECHTLNKGMHAPAIAFGWQNSSSQGASASASEHHSPTLDKSKVPAVAFQTSQSGVRTGDAHATLDAHNGSRRHHGALVGTAVRRLTPRECERLQGFPDDYTAITVRGKPAADGPRYKALGNSWAVPVVRWIGRRIDMVESITREEAA